MLRLPLGEMVLASATMVPWLGAFDDAVRAEDDLLGHGGVADAEEDAVGVLRHLLGCSAEPALFGGGQFFGLGGGVRPERHLVSGAKQIARHGIAHDSESEKSQLCHSTLLFVSVNPQLYDAAGMCDNCHPMKPLVLVTKRIYPEAIEFLKQHVEVDYAESDDGLTAEELLERIRGKQGVVSQLTDKFSAPVIEQLDGMRIIANVAVGFDNIDVPAATRRKILVTNTPDVLTDTTADFAFALLMAAARRVVEGHKFVHSGQWTKWRIDLLVGQDVHHRTLGIFGMGRIGQAVARRARGFSTCGSCITTRCARPKRSSASWAWSSRARNGCCANRTS